MDYNCASKIVYRVRSGGKFRKFFYRKTGIGRKILNNALVRSYGKLENRLPDGGYEFVRNSEPNFLDWNRCRITTCLDKNLHETKLTIEKSNPFTGEVTYFSKKLERPDGTAVETTMFPIEDTGDRNFRSGRMYTAYITSKPDNTGNHDVLYSKDLIALYDHVSDTVHQKTVKLEICENCKDVEIRTLVLNV